MAGGVGSRAACNNRIRIRNVLFFNSYNLEFMQQKLGPFDLEAALSGKKIIKDGVVGEYRFTNRNSESGILHFFQLQLKNGYQAVICYEEMEQIWFNQFSGRESLCQEVFMASEKKTVYFVIYESMGCLFSLISAHEDYDAALSAWECYAASNSADRLVTIHEITLEL